MSYLETYKKRNIVKLYSIDNQLQPPELTILNKMKDSLSDMHMLDIGVGGGRTTLHFSKLVKQYVGIDFSEDMITECNKKFSKNADNITFKVCDVRSMEIFEDNTFDFVLFSFNGIDNISHDDRIKAFKEIHRVGKPGAYFCFSTHNLQSIHKVFNLKYQLSWNLKLMTVKIFNWVLLRYFFNKDINIRNLKNEKYAIINDGAHNFSLRMYYINPKEQINQLRHLNFSNNLKVFSLSTGDQLEGLESLDHIDDTWLYFLCFIEKA